MKKQKATTNRRRKPTRATKKQSNKQGTNIDSKHSHNKSVREQLQWCEELTEHPQNLLAQFAGLLDDHGKEALGDSADECIQILDTVHSDLETYRAKLEPLKAEADAFLSKKDGEAWEWTMNAISICEKLTLHRDQHAVLFENNASRLNQFLNEQ